jgi:hypothetical protein
LKGALICLKTSSRYAWMLVWVVCILATSGIQSLLVQSQLETFFEARRVANSLVWSWLGAALVALLIYSHYQFLTNMAPRSVFWSYKFGFFTVKYGQRYEGTPKPLISPKYFENGPMKVSFKR